MARMIDAEKAMRIVREEYLRIKALPYTDAEPVVRCKKCKHHEDEENGMVYCPKVIGSWVSDNWFCADGEPKDE